MSSIQGLGPTVIHGPVVTSPWVRVDPGAVEASNTQTGPGAVELARETEIEVEMARAAEQYTREREQDWHRRAVGHARQNNMDWG